MRFDLKREGFNKIQIKIDFRSHSSQRTDGLNWLRDQAAEAWNSWQSQQSVFYPPLSDIPW